MYTCRMKRKFIIFPLLIIPLVSCSTTKEIKRNSFYFYTYVDTRLFEGNEPDLNNIDQIYKKLDKLTDNYLARDLDNVYKINNSTENVQIDEDLYKLLELTFSSDLSSLEYFNPLCGSLSKKWKESLQNKVVLDEITINEELEKMATSSLEFLGENTVKKVGEGEIDLGAVAKGYALDKAKQYLASKNYTKYLIDAGSSSILLGEKNNGGDFKIKISDLDSSYLIAKNCFISTSSFSRQNVKIDGKNYSHIINPVNGSAINENDTVIVVSDFGYLGDILSTDFVNESIDSIKELEKQFNVKTIVINDGKISYQNDSLEVTNK